MRTVLALIVCVLVSTNIFAAGEVVRYSMGDEPFEGYFVSPRKDAPLVLLLHDWDGLTDYEIKRAEMLADLGYSVFAADLFGAGNRPTEMKDKKQHTGELYKNRERMRALVQAAVDTAKAKGGSVENAVVMGYCFGGAAVLEYARSGANMKGFVTFHGGLKTPSGQDYTQAKGDYLILHGSADSNITMDQFADLTSELEQAGLKHEMVSYGGAPHAFTVFDSDRYRQDADHKSWQRFNEFLKAVLK